MYGKYQYGAFSFGDEPLTDEEEKSHLKPDLMSYLPPFWADFQEMVLLQDGISNELGRLQFYLDDLLDQYFVETATWGLDLWEQFLGLSTDRLKSFERRREIVKAKLRGAGTSTKAMMKNVAEAFSGGEVKIIEHAREYRFEVQFIGIKGIPQNMAGLTQAIEEIKPAHLAFSFKYTYTWWDSLKQLTWNNAAQMTWDELRIYE